MSDPFKFVIIMDDAGLSQPRAVEERSIRFFETHEVPASLFVIPELSDSREISGGAVAVSGASGRG